MEKRKLGYNISREDVFYPSFPITMREIWFKEADECKIIDKDITGMKNICRVLEEPCILGYSFSLNGEKSVTVIATISFIPVVHQLRGPKLISNWF